MNFRIMFRHEMRNLVHYKVTWVVAAGMVILMLFISINVIKQLTHNIKDIRYVIDQFMQLFVFHFALPIGIMLFYAFVFKSFNEEKVKRVLETLLSTPLGIKSIWLGKVTAIFVVSYVPSLIAIGLMPIIVNIFFIKTSPYVWPHLPALINLLVVTPIMLWSIIALTGLSIFILSDSRIINLLLFFMSFGYMFIASSIGQKKPISWTMTGIYFAIAAMLYLIARVLGAKVLTAERVVLTS